MDDMISSIGFVVFLALMAYGLRQIMSRPANDEKIEKSYHEGVFVLDLQQLNFLRGKTTKPHFGGIKPTEFIGCNLLLWLIMIVFVVSLFNSRLGMVGLTFFGIFLLFEWWQWRKFKQNQLIARDGHLIDGVIQNSHGEFVSIGRGWRVWTITITYAFTAPDGTKHTEIASAQRRDLTQYVPPVGARVRIMYVNPKQFRML